MDTETLLFICGVFLAVASCVGMLVWWLFTDRVRRRIADIQVLAKSSAWGIDSPWLERAVSFSRPLAKLSLPPENWETSPVRGHLMHAGWRGKSTPQLFYGAKTILAMLFPVVCFAASDSSTFFDSTETVLAGLVLSSGIGFFLPNLILLQRVAQRKREIFENFPDALDLLTICIEAGLGLDSALKKVADEIHIKSKVLFQELHLVLMELRTGYSREQALRNLATRTGVDEIEFFVAMLVQADRFGTSITDSIRIHSDNLRTKRKQKAEESAQKISLKLLFPLIFLIFPTLMLILAGPAILQIYRFLLPSLTS
jgi:tight adherence protein C